MCLLLVALCLRLGVCIFVWLVAGVSGVLHLRLILSRKVSLLLLLGVLLVLLLRPSSIVQLLLRILRLLLHVCLA